MDAHYEQVMAAREGLADGPPRAYFAYSTVLDPAAFEEWRHQHGYDFFQLPVGEGAEALDLGLVYDFPSRWWGGRVAGLEDRSGSVVHGLVFEVRPRDWPIVQHKEGLITHMCVEREVRVRTAAGERTATAFTTAPGRRSVDGPVSARFVEALVRGARAAGLPQAWIASLETVR
ncbi:MAG TPA: gamma-glutamylcyclotransferase [Myxococcaceae bacterium]|nr:gamma-glutamylcyclotransferase [Myxococcaceae bacterium]